MSNNKGKKAAANLTETHKLHICLFSTQSQITKSLLGHLTQDRYNLTCFAAAEDFIDFVKQHQEQIDCLIFVQDSCVNDVLNKLWELSIAIPIAIVETKESLNSLNGLSETYNSSTTNSLPVPTVYHSAEVRLYFTQLDQINSYINFAITKFINLAPNITTKKETQIAETERERERERDHQNFLVQQQRRLTEKLKERLGYLGVFYKRSSKDFYRNLATTEKAQLSIQLVKDYRQIILHYFDDNIEINSLIDKFVDRAFFADISISKILEIHMEIMDEFAQQLKIEGRSEEILLDYRLALIDIISHLCEMYRRSIPGENISLELLFGVE